VNSHSVLKEKLDAVLTSITERERAILEMRFGLVDGRGHTLEEIGNDPFTKSSTGKSRISI
jgi:RNA polymerase primary sigma factor